MRQAARCTSNGQQVLSSLFYVPGQTQTERSLLALILDRAGGDAFVVAFALLRHRIDSSFASVHDRGTYDL
jgi:hypothetical protein